MAAVSAAMILYGKIAAVANDTPPFYLYYGALATLSAGCLLFLILLYTPGEISPSIFDRLTSSRSDASANPQSPLTVCGEKAMATLLGGVLVMAAMRFAYVLLSGGPVVLSVWYGLVVFILATLLVYALVSGFPVAMTHFTVIFLLVSPLPVRTLSDSGSSFLYWSVCGLFIGLFMFPRPVARKYLYTFLSLLFFYPFADAFVHSGSSYVEMLWELVNLLFFGCGLYMAMDTYIAYTLRNQAELFQTSARLEEAQAVFTQKEKMAALGQLISGVAHEINTPMGAIKASSENMESSARALFTDLMLLTRDFSNDDINDFLTLTDICSQSVREMRNTMEMRRAKPQLTAFFKRIDPETASKVVELLSKMEICGMEKIENHIDVFKNPRLVELLTLLQAVFPYLNATQNIQFATSRVSKIVFALKSYSHTSLENEYLTFDLIGNLQNILVLYHNQMKYGVEVVREFDEDIPLVYGNPDELGQVWSNLIQNAIQAMNGVGTLTIRANLLSDETIKLVFKDTGGGIKPEHLSRMFEVFFTTKPPGEGSGLGLNICRRIVERHGGTITVDNRPGQGAAFIVTLPVSAAEKGSESV